jgi:hypothetical protein
MATILVAVLCLSAEAEQWSFFGSTGKNTDSFNFSDKPFVTVLSRSDDRPLEVFSGSSLASFAPIQLDQLVVSLMNVTPDGNPFAIDEKPFISQFHLETGIKTETRLINSQSPLVNKLFGSDESSLENTSSLIFVGVGLDFKSGYLKGNAFIGHPLDTLNNRLSSTKTSDGVKNQGLDTDTRGFEASAGYKLNEKIALGAGFGRMNDKIKDTEQTEEVYAVYAQAVLAIAPGINVKPEVGKIERIKEEPISDETRDESFYAGAIWEINF